ncbi:CRISPR-associated RAMP superfamily protein [Ligilactobacillus acidipiscis DSM 15836]|uniref:CRISPR-associated RAMP superfamily protein n=1 Tax=Ligilactobacillus acidipiscis DSM 15836 TaxID=1423716 RepID=A0ABR5PK38_9LACO|nr:CRISPR system precrRNA processing endoribonuclease RAMP protein Cas6 [Ligilactobacillus acidipiscis]KRM27531.1 CRISPR-associated RAMP superfamily protein [Ligilactobacillus acidipiscis DSM 15836]GAW64049.1 CRISPR-associated protein Cas6 [Ligilactobacillus acidipiscis]GEN21092.1 hypothetical protein LAC02_43730 [Ligilactobacillus acidipiscis]
MEKIKLICPSNGKKDYKLGVFFHAWLMDHIDEQQSTIMHENGTKPLTINVKYENSKVIFEVNLLTSALSSTVHNILLNESLTSFALNSASQKHYSIKQKQSQYLVERDLTKEFYNEKPQRKMFINFSTSTSFKSEGLYIFYPDLHLLFQSLMRKYNFVYEGYENIDKELLEDICANVHVRGYNLRSNHYSIHKARIPSFTGSIYLICSGTSILVSYINVLLKFAEYGGVGIKTALGMGAVRIDWKG